MLRKHFSFSSILIEIGSVILAVLLALAVNEWRQNRADQKLALSALHNIRSEVESNKNKLSESIPEHEKLLENIKNIRGTLAEAGHGKSHSIELDFDSLNKTAWNTANITNAIAHMPLEQVSEIADIYNLQQVCKERLEQALQFMSTVDFHDKGRAEASFKAFQTLIIHLITFEKILFEEYEKFLKTESQTNN